MKLFPFPSNHTLLQNERTLLCMQGVLGVGKTDEGLAILLETDTAAIRTAIQHACGRNNIYEPLAFYPLIPLEER